jgi:hypothetical protein
MTKPDAVVAKQAGVEFTPHPEGMFAMTCVDVINLGDRLKSFKGTNPYLAPTVLLVFQSGEVNEAGRVHEVSKEFTVSMGKKSALRPFLGAWRGKSYTDEQAREGVELHKLVGRHGLVSVEHRTSPNTGRTYANIAGIASLPKEMTAPSLPDYERPAFFAERIAKYAAEAEAFRKASAPAAIEDVPAGLDESDDGMPAVFAERIAKYAAEAEAFRKASALAAIEDVPAGLDESDDGMPW